MIFDTIQNIQLYKGMNKNLNTAINFIAGTRLEELSDGRTVIDGEDVYVNVSHNITAQPNNTFETHSRYLDIQMVLSGSEKFSVCKQGLSVRQAYDPVKDVAFYNGKGDADVILTESNFVICFPEEAHAPGLSISAENKKVKKAVFKVRVR